MRLGRLAWKQAHKRIRTYLISALGLAPVVYANSSFLQDFLPAETFRYLSGGLGALALIASLVEHDS